MNIRLMLALLFLIVFPARLSAVEFETSTGEEDMVFMSTDGEVNLGDSLAKSVEKRFFVVDDEAIQAKINEMGQKVAAVCDRKDIMYHFKVIDAREKNPDTPIINAFSLPGGYVYVFKDLYDRVANDDELEGVIAHEVGHIVARHSVKRMQASYGANILLILASRTQTSGQDMGKAFEAINSLMASYSRDDETFADKLAVKYCRKAGYNPEGMITFLQKLLEWQKKEPDRPYVGEADHPYLSIRISNTKEEVYGKMDFNAYINVPTQTRR